MTVGIFRDGDYTLTRMPHQHGLYVKVSHQRKTRATVSTDTTVIDKMMSALRLAWSMARARATGVDYCDGYEVALGYRKDQLVARVRTMATNSPVALIEAEYLPITSRVMLHDPSNSYEPVRHVVVQAGQAMLRHQRSEDRERGTRRAIAYRRVMRSASDAMLVTQILNINDTENLT